MPSFTMSVYLALAVLLIAHAAAAAAPAPKPAAAPQQKTAAAAVAPGCQDTTNQAKCQECMKKTAGAVQCLQCGNMGTAADADACIKCIINGVQSSTDYACAYCFGADCSYGSGTPEVMAALAKNPWKPYKCEPSKDQYSPPPLAKWPNARSVAACLSCHSSAAKAGISSSACYKCFDVTTYAIPGPSKAGCAACMIKARNYDAENACVVKFKLNQ